MVDVGIINAVSITERPGNDVYICPAVFLIFQDSIYLRVTLNRIVPAICAYIFLCSLQGVTLHSVLPWPGPVKPDAVRGIALPFIKCFDESFAPVERFMKRVVGGSVDEPNQVYAHWLDEAVVDCILNEGPDRIEESKDIRKDDGYRQH